MRSVAEPTVKATSDHRPSGQVIRLNAGLEPEDDAGTRTLMLGFLRLAVAALFVTGVFVLLVAVARTPLLVFAVGKDFLYTALVTHVIFALDIWLLSFVAVLWVFVAARLGIPVSVRQVWPGLALAWAGAALLVAVPLAGLGQPVMADYVPILTHPLFFLGLLCFLAGIAFPAAAFLDALRRCRPNVPLEAEPLAAGAVAYLVSLVLLALAALRWGSADYPSMVWGSGHLFQLVNASALVAVWLMLAPPPGQLSRGLIRLSLVGFAPAALAVVIYTVSPLRWEAVSLFFWGGVGTPIVVTWLVVVKTLLQQWRQREVSVGSHTFLLYSLALFAIGGLIALPGMGADTRVTAHYHASVGAVTMIFMGLAYRLLPRLGVEPARRRSGRLQAHLYGAGLLLLVGGLFLAGEAGTARKIFEAISRDPSLMFAAAIFGLGALVTIAGGIAFVAGVGSSLIRAMSHGRREAARQVAIVRAGRVS